MSNSTSEIKVGTPRRAACRLAGLAIVLLAIMGSPCMAEFGITSPAKNAVFCLGGALSPGKLAVWSDCATEAPQISASVGNASATMGGNTPEFENTDDVPLEEPGWITIYADDGGACGSSDVRDIAVVEFIGMTVCSPATSIGGDQYAVVKQPGCVLVLAELIPEIPSAGTDLVANEKLSWSGSGYQDTVSPRIKAVPTTQPLEATVTAACCNGGDTQKIWVIWAQIEPRFEDYTSEGNARSFFVEEGGDTLGPRTDEDDGITIAEAIGKVELVATLLPSGVNTAIMTGWDFQGTVTFHDYENGTTLEADSRPDNGKSYSKDLIPDNDDKIYFIDAPTCGHNFNFSHTQETYNNFTHWVTWKGTKCSDDEIWHYQARVDDDLDPSNRNVDGTGNDDTELNDIGTGSIEILDEAYYDPRS